MNITRAFRVNFETDIIDAEKAFEEFFLKAKAAFEAVIDNNIGDIKFTGNAFSKTIMVDCGYCVLFYEVSFTHCIINGVVKVNFYFRCQS